MPFDVHCIGLSPSLAHSSSFAFAKMRARHARGITRKSEKTATFIPAFLTSQSPREVKEMKSLVNVFLIWILWSKAVANGVTVLGNSKMLVCANDGSLEGSNLKKSKKCKNRIIVTLAAQSGQGNSTYLHALVDSVKEEKTEDEVKLKKPFRVQVTRSETTINYPMIYKGRVNHRPFETIVKKRHSAPCCGKAIHDRCTEGWFDEKNACPWWYHVPEEEQNRRAPYTKESTDRKTGKLKKVWASQGYCCICSYAEKHNRKKYYARGGRRCSWHIFHKVTHQAYAHCLDFDPLWDRVYEIMPPFLSFTITVKIDVVDRYIRSAGGDSIPVWKSAGSFQLSPSRLKGRTKDGRVLGEYVGDLQVSRRLENLANKHLVWPEWYLLNKRARRRHSWIKAGYKEWLLLDKHLFDFRGETCNRIGASFKAFKFGQSSRCRRKKGSCLERQPFHYLSEAQSLKKKKKISSSFLDFYGNFTGAKLVGKYKEPEALRFRPAENYNSVVVLTIDARKIVLVYNRSPGRLVEAYAEDFEAVSSGGRLMAIVLNTGKVMSDYTVTVSGCSAGIGQIPAKKLTIDAGQSKTVTFILQQFYRKATLSLCTVSLYDVKFQFMSSMVVNFSTSAPCYCPNTCNCTAGCGPQLMDCANLTDIAPPTNSSNGFGWLGKAFGAIGKFFKNLFSGFFSGFFFLVGVFVFLGAIKVTLDVCSKASKAAQKEGVGGEKQEKEITETRILQGTSKKWMLDSRQSRFVACLKGVFYFFYCPFLPCIRIGQNLLMEHRRRLRHRLGRLERKRQRAKKGNSVAEAASESDSDSWDTDSDAMESEDDEKKSLCKNEFDYDWSDEYSSSEADVSDEPQNAKELLAYQYPVFLNFYNSFNNRGLESPGETFSLCGQVMSDEADSEESKSVTFDLYKYTKQFLTIKDERRMTVESGSGGRDPHLRRSAMCSGVHLGLYG
ncbi:hapless 2-like isoform X2 [Oscarella lobularis]|uniref:hapless 2-like isoform X2 n=1 Tax=Oscarella lobularis TaxID=121494 RepID=UPI003314055D